MWFLRVCHHVSTGLYSRQIVIIPRKTKTCATYSGPEPLSGPRGFCLLSSALFCVCPFLVTQLCPNKHEFPEHRLCYRRSWRKSINKLTPLLSTFLCIKNINLCRWGTKSSEKIFAGKAELSFFFFLPLTLQPTVGFGLSNNFLPFFPICHQLSPSFHSQHLKISFYFLFLSFPGSSPSSPPFQFLSEDPFWHPILLHSLQVT